MTGFARHISIDTLIRVIVDLLDEAHRESRGRNLWAEPAFSEADPGAFSLGAEGADLDSLELLTAAGLVAEFFRLGETGVDDLLLKKRRLHDWADIVSHGLGEGTSGVTFKTSGTTGSPAPLTHTWASLGQEVAFLAEVFAGRSRIISTVPSHHIYGFLFTVLLPLRLGASVMGRKWHVAGSAAGESGDGDLFVSEPEIWQYLGRSLSRWPGGVWGVSSTAALPPEVNRRVCNAGLERLFEIYGSTETGGVGMRDDPGKPFELFPYYERSVSAGPPEAGESTLTRALPAGERREVSLPDRIEWHGPRSFFPRGRIDRVVQVGGLNVNLDRVERILSGVRGVASASVYPREVDGSVRLAATLMPESAASAEEIREGAEEVARARLRPAERPTVITVTEAPRLGSAL